MSMAGYTRSTRHSAGSSRRVYGRSYRNDRYEVDGTAAREYAFPDIYAYRNLPDAKAEKERRQIRKKQAAYRSLNIFLIMGMAALVVCCSLLMLYTTMTASVARREIAALQQELTQVQEKNNALREALHEPMDLNELYARATKDLGMVYPDESQIIYYSDGTEDFIRQFADIPNRD